MPQTFFPITPAEITTPGVSYNWANMDISALVSAGATGAILRVFNPTGNARPWCVRPNGSTHTLGLQAAVGGFHCWTMVGLDGDRIFEFNNVAAFNQVRLDLLGYTMPGAEFLPELVDISPAPGAWAAINLGPTGLGLIPATATGVMVDCFCYAAGARNYGLRMNGSADNRVDAMIGYRDQGVMVIGCDANQIIEGYRLGVQVRFYLVGYITDGCTFFLNGVDVTPAVGPGAFGPLGGGGMPITIQSKMGFLEIVGAAGGRFALDGIWPWLSSTAHQGAYCPADDWQAAYEFAGGQFFNVGYAHTTVPGSVTTDPATSVISSSATLNGTLDDDGGLTCDCGFEYGETPAYGKITPTQSRTTGQTFAQTAFPLKSNTTYYFRAIATNYIGTSYGAQRSFTTSQVPYYASLISPQVQTNPATDITEHTARLNGVVIEDGGVMGATRFQWGLTTEYGNDTSWQQGYGKGDEFLVDLNKLAEGQGFNFRTQFRVGGTLVSGSNMVFNTLSPLGPVILIEDEIIHLLEAV